MITFTLTDSDDTMTFGGYQIGNPLISAPIIRETDVETTDANISTYYSATKASYTINLGDMDSEAYAQLIAFRDRQYSNLKYPQITITGSDTLNVELMTAKISISEQRVYNSCGMVENVQLTFRESRQMP